MKHFWQEIQGWGDFQKLYASEVARAHDGDIFIEVGSWLGRSSAFMGVEIINSGKLIWLNCVDTFDGRGADYDLYPVVRDGKQFETFLKNIEPVKSIVSIHRMTSLEAAAMVGWADPPKADFIFLDGDHSYEAVKADLAAWWPKLKPGGHLAGHDYFYDKKRDGSAHTGVANAVCQFVMEHKLDKLTLFLEQDCWLVEKPIEEDSQMDFVWMVYGSDTTRGHGWLLAV